MVGGTGKNKSKGHEKPAIPDFEVNLVAQKPQLASNLSKTRRVFFMPSPICHTPIPSCEKFPYSYTCSI